MCSAVALALLGFFVFCAFFCGCTAVDDFNKFHVDAAIDIGADLDPLLDFDVPPDLMPPADLTPTPRYMAVQRVLDLRGCTVSTCHQAYAPLVIPAPAPPAMLSAAQLQQNYTNVKAETQTACDMVPAATCAAASLLLLKPLANDGVPHGGGTVAAKPFVTTDDTDYQTLLLWIEEGAVK